MITLFEYYKSYKNGLNITYSAVILDEKSRNKLLSTFIYPNEEYVDWTKIAHHMTICLGELPEHIKRYWIHEEITLTVTDIGISDKAVAVKVSGLFNIFKPEIEDGPKFQHITLAINSIDAKPKDSNDIENWYPVEPIKIKGIIEEIQI